MYTVYEERDQAAGTAAPGSAAADTAPVSPHSYSFIGYMTTFTFTNPFRTGGLPAAAMRVCQLIVMPHAQRQGHGKRLLQLAHDEVARLDMYELTVEDPNEAFCRMRDSMDLRNCLASGFFNLRAAMQTLVQRCPSFKLDQNTIERVGGHLRITRGQIRRCYEVLKLKALDAAAAAADSKGRADSPGTATEPAHAEQSEYVREATKAFRLEVKERLWNAHKAQLSKVEDKAQRLQALQMLWEDVAQIFRTIHRTAFR